MISGLLAAKSDTTRKEKIDKDLQKVDVHNLEIRATKPAAQNSKRSVLSARRSKKKKSKSIKRSGSVSRMETRRQSTSTMEMDDEVSFNTYSARM